MSALGKKKTFGSPIQSFAERPKRALSFRVLQNSVTAWPEPCGQLRRFPHCRYRAIREESPDGGLLRRRGLFNGRSFDVSVFVLPIGLVQEFVDDVSALLFLAPNFLRFRLFGEELVVYFPAH
jgi:hypothetical protein